MTMPTTYLKAYDYTATCKSCGGKWPYHSQFPIAGLTVNCPNCGEFTDHSVNWFTAKPSQPNEDMIEPCDYQLHVEDVFDAYLSKNKMHSFEGTSGVRKLDTICETLGYHTGQFVNGRPIENFLADNPGACDAIVEFIRNWVPRNDDWESELRNEIGEDEDGC